MLTIIRSYGCVKCQTRHTEGEPLYSAHLFHQSKHGIDMRLTDELHAVQVELAALLRLPSLTIRQAGRWQELQDRRDELVRLVKGQ